MNHKLARRLAGIDAPHTHQANIQHFRDLGQQAAREYAEAARICREAAHGNPDLAPLAEAMEKLA